MKVSFSSRRMLISHESKTALTGILSNIELLHNKKLAPKEAKRCINDIYSSGMRLLAFINIFLQSATKQIPTLDSKEETNQFYPANKINLSIRKKYWLSILLVEDELIIQRAHSKMLQDLGCHVEIAKDGYEALSMLTGAHHYEMVFMDIGLPAMNGIQTVEKIRQQEINKDISIVGLTAYQIDEVKEQCKAAGFNNVVSKPISQQALKSILHEVAKQRINYQIL